MNSKKQFRPGAIGALMDEYERAAEELSQLLATVSEDEFTKIVDTETEDEDCRSIQTIMKHVLLAGYGYALYLRELWKIPGERPEIGLLDRDETETQFRAMLRFTVETLEGRWEMSYEEIFAAEIRVRWGPIINIETLLEHAVLHILRHRRQIEKFLQNSFGHVVLR